MAPKEKSVEQQMVADAPVVSDTTTAPATDASTTEAQEWAEYVASLDEFTREQVNLADSLEAQYRNALEQREANREILRHLAKQGKVTQEVVDSFYPPKVMTKPRRRKDDTDESYAARVAAFGAENNGNAS
jgi:hypothetical protein